MRIGILGGTFNPVHIGHLILAEQARESLRLDKVIFIPAYLPPHKRNSSDIAAAADRLNMLRIAIAGNPYFAVSTVEIKKKGISYSVETLRKLRKSCHNARFFLLVGADEDIDTWRETRKIQQMCAIVIANRPGYKNIKHQISNIKYQKISVTQLDISSTMIRRYIKQSKSARYLVPNKVYSYIVQNGLYIK